MELIHVSPNNAGMFWPQVAAGVAVAMHRGGLGSFKYVQECVLRGDMDIFLAYDGKVHACAITDILETEWKKTCTIVACYGHKMGLWVHLLEKIEDWAREQGCSSTRIMGRKGWARILPDYRETRVVLQKELN